MSDIRVQIRFRNDLLQRLLEEAPEPIYEIARKAGVNYGWIMGIKALGRSPWKLGREEFSENAQKLAAYFRVTPEVLFPEEIYRIKWPSMLEKSFPAERIACLVQSEDQRRRALPPDEAFEEKEKAMLIEKMIGTLTPREQRIIQMRFGFDGEEQHTYEEIGGEFEVTRETIRNIETKAFRKLRHPSRNRLVRESK